jgi:multicomponent Na+:H+ antiporter subunit E
VNPANPPLPSRARWRNRIVTGAALVTVWVLLWGTLSWGNVVGGLIVAALVVGFFPLPPVTFAGRIRPVGLLRFALHFVADLVVASVHIAWLAFHIRHTPRSAVVAVRLRVGSDLNLTLVSAAISLVPGSLIIEADRTTGTLYVHVLGVRDVQGAADVRRRVLELERRLIRAIGSTAELELVNRPLPGAYELDHPDSEHRPKETR